MRRIEILIPSIALFLFAAIAIPSNLSCRVYFRAGSTTTLAFSFGWPFSYFKGSVPGPGIRTGVGPNYVWGHPEMNDDDDIMNSIRQRHLSGLSLTPWGMSKYGKFCLLGLVVNGLLAGCVWPIVWLICRHVVADQENQERYKPFSIGDRVRFREGAFKEYVGCVEDIDVDKGHVTVHIEVSNQEFSLQVPPEQIKKA